MYYVFLDTNILLTFYSFNEEHLDKLKSISQLIKDEKIKLILTEQVYNEFIKNREKQLKNTKEFVKSLTNIIKSPLTHHDFEEVKKIHIKRQEIKVLAEQLLDKIEPMIENETLPADKVLNEIFSNVNKIRDTGDYFYKKAKIRKDKGLPPGKKGSCGDEFNWEIILSHVPNGKDVNIISADTDFSSILDKNRIHPFLKKEWEKLKSSNIHYYFGSISKFLKEKFPGLKITDEVIETEVKSSEKVINVMEYYESSATDKSLGYPAGGAYWGKINAEYLGYPESIYNFLPYGLVPVNENGIPDWDVRPLTFWENPKYLKKSKKQSNSKD